MLLRMMLAESFCKGNSMITFDEVVAKLKAGKSIELKFNLNGGVYSRHLLSLDDGILTDESFVDGSITNTTVARYKKSFYGKAFNKNAVQLLEEIEL